MPLDSVCAAQEWKTETLRRAVWYHWRKNMFSLSTMQQEPPLWAAQSKGHVIAQKDSFSSFSKKLKDVIRVPLWVELIWTCLFLFSVQLLQYFVGLLLCFQKKKTYIKQNKWVKCFFFFLLLSPQITEKWPSFLQADTSFPSASSCPKRHWSPPLRGNTAASVIGSKWSSTDPGPQSGNSRRSSQSSSPSTSTLQLYWWGCCSINVSSPPARFSAQFRAPAHWLLSFTGATGWNKGQNGPSMVPQLRTGVGNSENRPQGLHTW